MNFIFSKLGRFFSFLGLLIAIISFGFSIYYFTLRENRLFNEYFYVIVNLLELILFITIGLLSAKIIEKKAYNKLWIIPILVILLTLMRIFIT